MPELPEVETVVRFLRPFLLHKTIRRVLPAPDFAKVLDTHSPPQFNWLVAGQAIGDVRRRGKYIVLDLSAGHLLIHLRMTGRLLVKPPGPEQEKHVTCRIQFTDGLSLFFLDTRKFGRLFYYPDLSTVNARLGVEPLSADFTAAWLIRTCRQRRRMLKPLLLDQSLVAGLGNIYADECLWRARIHPRSRSHHVSAAKLRTLHAAIQSVLRRAIDRHGTTIISFSFGDGESGEFAAELQVFDRTGEPCPRCGSTLEKTVVAQRGTHLCPRCQVLKS